LINLIRKMLVFNVKFIALEILCLLGQVLAEEDVFASAFPSNLSSAHPSDRPWTSYSLGDVIKNIDRIQYEKIDNFVKHWPESIAYQYHNAIRDKNKDHSMKCLTKIVRNYTKTFQNSVNLIPENDTAVVHLRLGDVVDVEYSYMKQKAVTSEDLWHHGDKRGGWRHFVAPKKYFAWARSHFPSYIKRVVIVYSLTHFDPSTHLSRNDANHTLSHEYINHVVSYFESTERKEDVKYDVIKRHGAFPDDDFVFMANSRVFVCSGGGFSYAAAAVLEYRERLSICSHEVQYECGRLLKNCMQYSSKMRKRIRK